MDKNKEKYNEYKENHENEEKQKFSLIVKSYDEHEVKCSQTTFERLESIIKKQNKMLLKDISKAYKWDYSELRQLLEK